jgi:hypothetical protein
MRFVSARFCSRSSLDYAWMSETSSACAAVATVKTAAFPNNRAAQYPRLYQDHGASE